MATTIGITGEALDAAATALASAACKPQYDGRDMAGATLTAALPHIREAIAKEIEALLIIGGTGTQVHFNGAIKRAARVARGQC